MIRPTTTFLATTLTLAFFATLGCGPTKPGTEGTPPDFSALAKQKVAVMKKIADGVADPAIVVGGYEEFLNLPLEIKDHPAEVREILDLYNKHVKGKIKGETAAQLQQDMNRYQAVLATVK